MVELCKNWSQWLSQTRFSYMGKQQVEQTMRWLETVRDAIFVNAEIQKGDKVIDIGTGTGLLALKALELLEGSGKVIFSDMFEDCLKACDDFLKNNGITSGYEMLHAPAEKLGLRKSSVDKALMRSVLVHIVDKQAAIDEVFRILKKGGKFCAFEPIISSNTRYWELISPTIENYEKFKAAENEFMSNPNDSLTNFDENTLAQNLEKAGFADGSVDLQTIESTYKVDRNMVQNWMITPPAPGKPTMKDRFLMYFNNATVTKFLFDVQNDLDGKEITIVSNAVLITAVK